MLIVKGLRCELASIAGSPVAYLPASLPFIVAHSVFAKRHLFGFP
ncbi:hypothetical protein RISK_002661 [Rhodopirellula islandica]|uniref:Uncharacterized protein n=1 Tax=Rhodopirellula islandica TaxID=595434 RepID=A0A0J1BFD0_RHOIS|nr:hypothetical protein RISK_002661 [Rhodopirellula islandica]